MPAENVITAKLKKVLTFGIIMTRLKIAADKASVLFVYTSFYSWHPFQHDFYSDTKKIL